MEGRSEGTPNPLSPKIEVGPITEPSVLGVEVMGTAPVPGVPVKVTASPKSKVVDPMITVRPIGADVQPAPVKPAPVQPAPEPAPAPTQPAPTQPADDPLATLGVVTNMDGSIAENIDPMNRPMQPAQTVDVAAKERKKKKRKRTALIVGVIISLFLAIGCGVAAVLLTVHLNKVDPVAKAVERLMSADAPANIMLDGEAKINFKNSGDEISSVKISADAEAVLKTMINSAVVNLQANLRDGSSFEMKVSEIYAAKGDLYVKVENVSNWTEDGWLRIPLSEVDASLPDEIANSNMFGCATDLLNSGLNNGNTIARLYSQYPFIASTDQDISVTSERDPIYKVIVNDNFEKFATEAQNTGALKSFSSCLGRENGLANANDLISAAQKLPEIFVEVNDNYNFTRAYFTFENNEMELEVDLRFSYPTNVNVPEPLEYKDISEVLQLETDTVEDEITEVEQ